MESRLQQIKSDPNFCNDDSTLERVRNNLKIREYTVITPNPESSQEFTVMQQFPQRIGFFLTSTKRKRRLRVLESGEMEVYAGEKKVAENPYLYLFHERAINLYEQIKQLSFYCSFELGRHELCCLFEDACFLPFIMLNEAVPGLRYQQHCETLNLFYQSDHYGKMKIGAKEHDVVNAVYILSIDRQGKIAYQLRYHTKDPETFDWHPYQSIDDIHDPIVKAYHLGSIGPILATYELNELAIKQPSPK